MLTCNLIAKPHDGARIDVAWEYNNPRRLLQKGPKWTSKLNGRLEFDFCFRTPKHESCDVWKTNKKGYKTQTQVKDTMRSMISTPVPDEVIIVVDIHVTWLGLLPTLVGSFISEPLAIKADGSSLSVNLKRKGDGHRNDDVKFSVVIKLSCNEHNFGDKCETYCRPVIHRFDCSPGGEKVCYPGLTGEQCNIRDACYFQRCAQNATCVNMPDGSGRRCLCNGKDEPRCYPKFNACLLGPCKNGGICHTVAGNADDFFCNCTSMWQGPTCTERRSACDEKAQQMRRIMIANDSSVDPSSFSVSVCMNGGKCFEDPDRFAFFCVCPGEWTGARCETPKSKPNNTQYLLLIFGIPLASFILLAGLLAAALGVWCHLRKKRKSNKIQNLYLPYPAVYTPGRCRESAPIHGSTFSSFSDERPLTLIGLPSIPIRDGARNPLRRQKSSVYDECSDNGYMDMLPFNPIYQSDHIPASSELEEPIPPALPTRPSDLNSKSSLEPSSTKPDNRTISTDLDRTSLTVTTLGSSSEGYSGPVQSSLESNQYMKSN
ncbi:hypothetical protein FBUS_02348 [Fasciolopsis buskii]|uniref:Delta-like protein n=1 Tax=Fasciolopsis buskii TaxID=27845 RepID=A0A8E0RU13_9TREM|nr:hypothetical protein FBUS_02348 [Fasciolopsis buski]